MRKPILSFVLWLTIIVRPTAGAEVTIVVNDPNGTAARVGAPVSCRIDLAQRFGDDVKAGQLHLRELSNLPRAAGRLIPMQFEAEAPESPRGTLWWIMPPGPAGERRFQVVFVAVKRSPIWNLSFDKTRRCLDLSQQNAPVLRYNHGPVPVPQGIAANYERGDYISPLFGPYGEVLTDDYPRDHPHHRGVSWSWPVTRWKEEVRDIWACVGVWSRPVAMRRSETGPVMAVIDAENSWKWGDKDAIVREEVVIRAFLQRDRCRFVDVEVRLTALADEVAIGGRPQAGYGGFGLRAAPTRQPQIVAHADPPEAKPRRAWLDYSGVFVGGKGLSGVAIFEHVTNPDYPSGLHQYPDCNYVMPAFPGPREVPLSKDKPLVLRHRLWIHPGGADEKKLADVWAAYANPPRITIM